MRSDSSYVRELSAPVLRRVLAIRLETPVPMLLRAAAVVVSMFLFGCRASTTGTLRASDIEVTEAQVTAVLVHLKVKRAQDPLVSVYGRHSDVDFSSSLLTLLRRRSETRPPLDAIFTFTDKEGLTFAVATHAVTTLVSAYGSRGVRAYQFWQKVGERNVKFTEGFLLTKRCCSSFGLSLLFLSSRSSCRRRVEGIKVNYIE
jgi:hypothetical protein